MHRPTRRRRHTPSSCPGLVQGAACRQRALSRAAKPESQAGHSSSGSSPDRRHKIVRTVTPEGVAVDAELSPPEARVFAASCDQHAIVAAVGQKGTRDVQLRSCAYLGPCTTMRLPRFGATGAVVRFPLDVARVDGATILAVPMHGIVRVASTRDDGRSWTPLTIAFDAEAHPDLRYDVPIPDHLLAVGHKVQLYGRQPIEGDVPAARVGTTWARRFARRKAARRGGEGNGEVEEEGLPRSARAHMVLIDARPRCAVSDVRRRWRTRPRCRRPCHRQTWSALAVWQPHERAPAVRADTLYTNSLYT